MLIFNNTPELQGLHKSDMSSGDKGSIDGQKKRCIQSCVSAKRSRNVASPSRSQTLISGELLRAADSCFLSLFFSAEAQLKSACTTC